MHQYSLLTLFIFCMCGSTNVADDYVLRIDTVGYLDKVAADNAPDESVLRSIEVIARPDSAFHGKVVTGKETLIVDGQLYPSENGTFKVLIRYTYSIDTGVGVIIDKDGHREPLPTTTAFKTTMDKVNIGDRVIVGGFDTMSSTAGKAEIRSMERFDLVLEKYVPPVE